MIQKQGFQRNKLYIYTYFFFSPDQFLNFAEKKAEFANLFGLSREEKQNRQNGTVHNNNDIKKIK